MFKLVVLLSVAALAAAKPGLVPVTYSSVGVVPAVSSLSQYSSSVVHGSPLAYSSAYPGVYAAAPYAAAPYAAAPYGYAAVAQAPHSPAVVLDAVHGVPLDTPEVVAARAAHYQAKALSGLHHLKKRSVASVAPVAYSSYAPVVSAYSTAPVVSAYSTAPVVSAYSSPLVSAYTAYSPVVSPYSSPVVSAYSSPLAYHGVVPKAVSVHPW